MAFADIPKVEDVKTYMDMAIQKAKKLSTSQPITGRSYLEKKKKVMEIYIDSMIATLDKQIGIILDAFPHTKHLSGFYDALMKATIDQAQYKKSLGALNWAKGKIHDFHSQFAQKMARARDNAALAVHKKEFVGRISSVMKQVKTDFTFLDNARKTFRTYPTIKMMSTVCLAGFPNVGKSTLLGKITSATPEIQNYAFTTTTLNLGYTEINHSKVQFIDTPGTLNRDKMNVVEKHAYLALKHVATVIVFVYDLTEECGYTVAQQDELFAMMKDFDVPVIVYYAKADLMKTKPKGITMPATLLQEVAKYVTGQKVE